MDRETFQAEFLELFQEMDQEGRAWVIEMARELVDDLRADRILQEALGTNYEPLNPRTWRPSTLPPNCGTWAEFDARVARGRLDCPPPGV